MEIAFIALFTLSGVIICHSIAKRRGANTLFWAVMGALFGPLAIPFSLLSKPKKAIN